MPTTEIKATAHAIDDLLICKSNRNKLNIWLTARLPHWIKANFVIQPEFQRLIWRLNQQKFIDDALTISLFSLAHLPHTFYPDEHKPAHIISITHVDSINDENFTWYASALYDLQQEKYLDFEIFRTRLFTHTLDIPKEQNFFISCQLSQKKIFQFLHFLVQNITTTTLNQSPLINTIYQLCTCIIRKNFSTSIMRKIAVILLSPKNRRAFFIEQTLIKLQEKLAPSDTENFLLSDILTTQSFDDATRFFLPKVIAHKAYHIQPSAALFLAYIKLYQINTFIYKAQHDPLNITATIPTFRIFPGIITEKNIIHGFMSSTSPYRPIGIYHIDYQQHQKLHDVIADATGTLLHDFLFHYLCLTSFIMHQQKADLDFLRLIVKISHQVTAIEDNILANQVADLSVPHYATHHKHIPLTEVLVINIYTTLNRDYQHALNEYLLMLTTVLITTPKLLVSQSIALQVLDRIIEVTIARVFLKKPWVSRTFTQQVKAHYTHEKKYSVHLMAFSLIIYYHDPVSFMPFSLLLDKLQQLEALSQIKFSWRKYSGIVMDINSHRFRFQNLTGNDFRHRLSLNSPGITLHLIPQDRSWLATLKTLLSTYYPQILTESVRNEHIATCMMNRQQLFAPSRIISLITQYQTEPMASCN